MSDSAVNPETFRALLLRARAELLGDSRQMRRDALASEKDGSGANSAAPIHLADHASDARDVEFSFDRLSASADTLRLIDEALEKIEAGAFGACEECGAPIGERRLRAKPWASLCVECKRKEESL